METTITGLIVISLLLIAVVTIGYAYFSAQSAMVVSFQEMSERLGDRARTNIVPQSATTLLLGTRVELTLKNEGTTKLADFQKWDVIVQYQGEDAQSHTLWVPYGSGSNTWTYQLYLAAPDVPEVVEPDILNTGEEMVLQVSLSPAVTTLSTNSISVATPNGIRASTVFTR
jgi:hypothetical protein